MAMPTSSPSSCIVSQSSDSYVRPATTPEATDPMMLVSSGFSARNSSVAVRKAAAES